MQRPYPVHPLMPIFDWLDRMIDQYGLEMFLAYMYLTPFLIVWILSGGFWRRRPLLRQPPRLKKHPKPPVQTSVPPLLVPEPTSESPPDGGDDIRWFAA